jgi:hypothetical protein
MKAPKWNSLGWLADREMERKGEVTLSEKDEEFPRATRYPFCLMEISSIGPSKLV